MILNGLFRRRSFPRNVFLGRPLTAATLCAAIGFSLLDDQQDPLGLGLFVGGLLSLVLVAWAFEIKHYRSLRAGGLDPFAEPHVSSSPVFRMGAEAWSFGGVIFSFLMGGVGLLIIARDVQGASGFSGHVLMFGIPGGLLVLVAVIGFVRLVLRFRAKARP